MAHYNIAYDFKETLVGSYRNFNKDDQTITLRLSSQAGSGGRSDNFTVLLQRQLVIGYTTERTASFPRNGLKQVQFKDLPAGLYRLRFEKSTDGVKVIGVGVMHN
ncbi:MAG: hypothetical protein ACQEWU_20450 [Bacillota bacterium]